MKVVKRIALIATAVTVLAGCDMTANLPEATSTPEAQQTQEVPVTSDSSNGEIQGDAITVLNTLTVAEKTDNGIAYDRDGMYLFETSRWKKSRQDTRERDMNDIVKDDNGDVIGGWMMDPYIGEIQIDTVMGPIPFDVEHIVALEDAHKSGASVMDASTRANIANDPLNLMMADGSQNRSKGSQDASTWAVPENPSFAPQYVAMQIAVKAKYGLSVSDEEKAAMQQILSQNPDVALPANGTFSPIPVAGEADMQEAFGNMDPAEAVGGGILPQEDEPAETSAPATIDSSSDPSFKNCSEARAAGYSNMKRGEPGYAEHMDGNNDGVACE